MKLLFFALTGLIFLLLIAFIFRQFSLSQKTNLANSFSLKITALISLVIVAITILAYGYLGSLDQLTMQKTKEQKLYIEYSKVLSSLAQRINQQPNNPYAWYLLAQGHLKLGQLSKAQNYIERAYELDLADDKVDFGEILLVYAKVLASEQGDFKDETSFDLLFQAHQQLIAQSQKLAELGDLEKEQIQTSLIEAKWLLGFAHFNRGQIEQALALWQELDNFELEPNQRELITEAIEQLDIYQANRFEIKVLVDIEPSLIQKIEASASLFVVLRQGGLTDESMPLAAKKINNLTFPRELTLNQDDLLIKNKVISREQKFKLQAFISQKSMANIRPNDLITEVIELEKLAGLSELLIEKIEQ